MNKQTPYQLAKGLINVEYFKNIPIEQIPLWEIRDSVSSNYKKLELSLSETALVNEIVSNTLNNIDYKWSNTDLSIIGEAEVQRILLSKGYNLLCYNLNEFPQTSRELSKVINKLSIYQKLKTAIRKLVIANPSASLDNVLYNWGPKVITKTFGILAILIYGLIVAPESMLYVLLVNYIVVNSFAIVTHDYWVHNFLVPKNRLIGFIVDLYGMVFYRAKVEWIFDHLSHHIHWKTPDDPAPLDLTDSRWRIIWASIRPSSKPQEYKAHMLKYPPWSNTYIAGLLPEIKFLHTYQTQVFWAVHILTFLIFGFSNYLFFLLLPAFLLDRYNYYFQ